MNEKERLMAVLDHEEVDRVPCACPLQTGTIDLMKASGAYWPEAHVDADAMTKLARAARDLACIESIRVPFEVSVDASAFGAPTDDRRLIRQPLVLNRMVKTDVDLFNLKVPDPLMDGRVPVVLEAIRTLSNDVPDTPIICGVIGPFMLACQLRGEQLLMKDLSESPDIVRTLLNITTEWGIDFSIAALEAGADIICIVDSAATGEMLNQSMYDKFTWAYERRIAKAIRGHDGRSILHICGDTSRNLELMVETNVDGISVDHCVPMSLAKRIFHGRTAAIGNIAPITTLMTGTPLEVAQETHACLDQGADVIAPGCGFAPETPLENMRVMARTTRSYVRRAGGPG
ncbi:MAG: MtaA/CmuA family methyltransferase [Methanomassiliicoccales archaeon]|nr:MtaA/CmuA family methyltransferase [Methanomassiliicoccales archaeon]